jgi:hypothetical protein
MTAGERAASMVAPTALWWVSWMADKMVDEMVAKSVERMGQMTGASQVVLWVAMTVGRRADRSVHLSTDNLV